jgi:outer membrane immunogenic protein
MDMHTFRTQLLATTAILALSGAAYAADMPVKAPPPAAPVPYVANWTGFYVGGQVGGASFEPSCHSDALSVDEGLDPCLVEFEGTHTSGSFSSASVIGGGRIGADYQWGPVVLGVVGEFDWMNLHGTRQTTFNTEFDPIEKGATLSAGAKIDWIASARGRIGWAFGNFLPYATGGVAWTQVKTSIGFAQGPEDDAAPDGDFPSLSGGGTSHKTGGVAGAGFEYMVAPHVSVFGEVLWYGFGSGTVSEFCAVCGGTGHTYTTTFDHQDIVSGTLGVNWRF